MALSEPTRIDMVAEAPDGTVVLGLVAEAWDHPRSAERLTDKLQTYLSYAQSGEYRDRFGSKNASVHVISETEPPPQIRDLLRAVEAATGVPIRIHRPPAESRRNEPEIRRRDDEGKQTTAAKPTSPAKLTSPAGRQDTMAAGSQPDPARANPIRRMFSALGLLTAGFGALLAWYLSRSVALAIFVFLMASLIVARGMAAVTTDPQKIRRALYLSVQPIGSTAILVLVWRQWDIPWLAALAGFVGGAILTEVVGSAFFKEIHIAENRETDKRMRRFRRWRKSSRGGS
ncbi:MAG: hypothetical protein R6T96_09275 [Longimicrobiales bacterium]